MAQDFGNTLPPELEAERQRLLRRQRVADAAMMRGNSPLQPVTPGAPVSPFAGIAQILNAYTGARGQKEVDSGMTALGQKYNEGLAQAVRDYTAGATTTKQPDPFEFDQMGEGTPTPKPVEVPTDPRARVAQAMTSPYAPVRQLAQADYQMGERRVDRAEDRAFREQQAREAREQRMREIEMRIADSRTAAAERAQLQRELAQMQDATRREIAGQSAALRQTIAAQGGRPPAGYRYTPDGNLQAIPGGPADTKIQGAYNADTAALSASEAALNRLGEQVNLVKSANLGRVTGLAGALPNVPGQAGADAQARLDTLRQQVGFTVLQALKDVSKSGASGLGQVTEREHAMLQQQLGNLDKAQSEDEIRRVLGDIEKFVEQSKGRLRGAYNLKHGDKQPSSGGEWSVVR